MGVIDMGVPLKEIQERFTPENNNPAQLDLDVLTDIIASPKITAEKKIEFI